MSVHLAAATDRVLIVGAGLTGALTCYHIRRALGNRVRIDVADMARGAGGRMSTTRYEGTSGPVRANTGAQYVSAASREAENLLARVCANNGVGSCALDRVAAPAPRSTHFSGGDVSYSHWLPREGTNSVVKQFLYGGAPDDVAFGARLERVAADAAGRRFRPVFDRGAGAGGATYAAVVVAMPPKDILKVFGADVGAAGELQSQATLHRRTNRGKASTALPPGFGSVALPRDVVAKLASVAYVGRYSLALWLDEDFGRALADAWRARAGGAPHDVIDAIVVQPGGVVVAQSTVQFWRRVSGLEPARGGGAKRQRSGGRGGGGGRDAARSSILDALAALAGGAVPRARHTKLLNWRTSQVASPGLDPPVVTAADGALVFTGDWCVESSFEGCHRAARAAADAVASHFAAPRVAQGSSPA